MMMFGQLGLPFLAAFLAVSPLARADLPVHCLRHQVVGEWRFILSSMHEERTSCGHFRPDNETQPNRSEVESDQLDEQEKMLVLTMQDPNIAETGRDPNGTWTMIYDEGFEVNVQGLNFFAFSNYTYEKNLSAPDTKYNVSHCGYTMVGWYQNLDRTAFGCYYGYKIVQDDESSAESDHVVALAAKNAAEAAAKLATEKAKKSKAYDKPMDHHTQQKHVSKVNGQISALELGWKARPMEKWNGRTMREMNKYAGLKRPAGAKKATMAKNQMLMQRSSADRPVPESQGDATAAPQSFLQRGRKHHRHHRKHRTAPADGLPSVWDWSDINGRDYLEPVMDQSDCGSCYAASSMRMLTSRHKIKQNDTEAIPWSINFPLMCSEYNQGCQGGYGILTAKWSRDVGLLPATCMRYNTGGSCKLECDLDKLKGQKRYRAANHRYVGSWYGNSSVESIKSELYHNGPVVLGLEPAEDFMFYSEGIYKSTQVNLLHTGENREWEKVDHAVLLVGWGEDNNGQKYWKLQNSWGPDWGEDGFFRMAAGENECGIESIAEAADVVEDEQDGKQVEAYFKYQPMQDKNTASATTGHETL